MNRKDDHLTHLVILAWVYVVTVGYACYLEQRGQWLESMVAFYRDAPKVEDVRCLREHYEECLHPSGVLVQWIKCEKEHLEDHECSLDGAWNTGQPVLCGATITDLPVSFVATLDGGVIGVQGVRP